MRTGPSRSIASVLGTSGASAVAARPWILRQREFSGPVQPALFEVLDDIECIGRMYGLSGRRGGLVPPLSQGKTSVVA